MQWGSGGYYYEAPVRVLDNSLEQIGYGFAEAVGWDAEQIMATVKQALRVDTPSSEQVSLAIPGVFIEHYAKAKPTQMADTCTLLTD